MARHVDRHIGRRENVWFAAEDHEQMLASMREMRATNKSDFIRAAVAHYISALNRRWETKHETTKGNK